MGTQNALPLTLFSGNPKSKAKTMKPSLFLLHHITIFLLLLTSPGSTTTPPLSIPPSTRAHWIRQTIAQLPSLLQTPCPFAPFSTIIVNHTSSSPSSLGTPICIGANTLHLTGNPTHHGEIAAINNCSALFTDPGGDYRLSPREALEAFGQLTLYTNAEACAMCAGAVRWAGFREYVYGTSIGALMRMGWGQIEIGSEEVFERSGGLGGDAGVGFLLEGVLAEETDELFAWQFDGEGICPEGCVRREGTCVMVEGWEGDGGRVHDEI